MQPEVDLELAKGSITKAEASRWCSQVPNPVSGRLYWWIYMTYLWKYYDFVDTVLLCLKKKPTVFLHVFHHATVPLCAWMGFEGRLLMPLWMGMGINSIVHTLMYFYYFLQTCGRKVWWRILVTQVQTAQFVLGAIMTMYGSYHYFKQPSLRWDPSGMPRLDYHRGCDAEAWAIYTCGWFNLAFLVLFVQWYASTYGAGRAKQKNAAGEGKLVLENGSQNKHEKTC